MTSKETINSFYKAIIDKKAEEICQKYVPDENTYVVLEGPRFTTLGYSNIEKGWKDFCDSALSLKSIDWMEGPLGEESGEMAWLSGIIQLTVLVKEKEFTVRFRASFVLMKNNRENWQIRHEHVSAPMEDPYGIGDWLKK